MTTRQVLAPDLAATITQAGIDPALGARQDTTLVIVSAICPPNPVRRTRTLRTVPVPPLRSCYVSAMTR